MKGCANSNDNIPHKTSVAEYEVGGQKFRVTSHYVGDRRLDDALEEIAVSRAFYEDDYCKKVV
jgi:hypothetical protein